MVCTYFAVRHGHSEGNAASIIVSSPEKGCSSYGLTEAGRDQAAQAAETLISTLFAQKQTETDIKAIRIIASDYVRTIQTAHIVFNALWTYISKAEPSTSVQAKSSSSLLENLMTSFHPVRHARVSLETSPLLRERYFGVFDGQSSENYALVWEQDVRGEDGDAKIKSWNVEPVHDVAKRVETLVLSVESEETSKQTADEGSRGMDQKGKTIVVLVAHGDILQISEVALWKRKPPGQHRVLGGHLETGGVRSLGRFTI
ncbi:hypothetical protein HK102_002797 [Quaeritorhiza haematococci]|nr:hypothetical protein HK102_002797 [Quaeritorhiza haematococci]